MVRFVNEYPAGSFLVWWSIRWFGRLGHRLLGMDTGMSTFDSTEIRLASLLQDIEHGNPLAPHPTRRSP